jgi:hypothetical protein
MTITVSVSVKGAREGAAAKELDRLGALRGEIGERHHQVLVELLAGDVPGPGVDRHVADFEVLAQRKASEHWQAAKDVGEVLLEDGFGALASLFAQAGCGRLHEDHFGAARFRARIPVDRPGFHL